MDTANETRRTTVRLPLSLVSRLFSTRYLYSRRGGRKKKTCRIIGANVFRANPFSPFFPPRSFLEIANPLRLALI